MCSKNNDKSYFKSIFHYLGQSSVQDQSNLATQDNSCLGVIGYRTVVEAVKVTKANKQKHNHHPVTDNLLARIVTQLQYTFSL